MEEAMFIERVKGRNSKALGHSKGRVINQAERDQELPSLLGKAVAKIPDK